MFNVWGPGLEGSWSGFYGPGLRVSGSRFGVLDFGPRV